MDILSVSLKSALVMAKQLALGKPQQRLSIRRPKITKLIPKLLLSCSRKSKVWLRIPTPTHIIIVLPLVMAARTQLLVIQSIMASRIKFAMLLPCSARCWMVAGLIIQPDALIMFSIILIETVAVPIFTSRTGQLQPYTGILHINLIAPL